MKYSKFFSLFLIVAIALAGCASAGSEPEEPMDNAPSDAAAAPTEMPEPDDPADEGVPEMTPDSPAEEEVFSLTSSAFEDQQNIPPVYTCDSENISPPLAWEGVPAGTQSFALILDDPDAPSGTFTHWVLFDLPADMSELAEGASTEPELEANHGMTSFGEAAYGGPCPPSGVHHYIFTLYAADTTLDLAAGASKEDVLEALDGHVLGWAELVGLYEGP